MSSDDSDDMAWTLYFPNKEYCDHPQCSASATRIVVQISNDCTKEHEVKCMPVCERHEKEIKEGRH